MSALSTEITGFVVGDDLEIRRTVTDLPAAVAKAWLTIKRLPSEPDADAKVLKAIAVTDLPGTGQIVTAGGVGTDGDVRFDLVPADTLALGIGRWVYDIQIGVAGGKVYTIEKGTLQLTMDVTKATS
jgi:hypothetical protein